MLIHVLYILEYFYIILILFSKFIIFIFSILFLTIIIAFLEARNYFKKKIKNKAYNAPIYLYNKESNYSNLYKYYFNLLCFNFLYNRVKYNSYSGS